MLDQKGCWLSSAGTKKLCMYMDTILLLLFTAITFHCERCGIMNRSNDFDEQLKERWLSPLIGWMTLCFTSQSTVKVIWRRELDLKSHSKDILPFYILSTWI